MIGAGGRPVNDLPARRLTVPTGQPADLLMQHYFRRRIERG